MPEENNEFIILTDEEGNESKFEILGSRELDGVTYVALVPVEDNEDNEYVILKVEVDEETEEEILVTIEDDDEFDRISDIFEDELFDEIDYDESAQDGKSEE